MKIGNIADKVLSKAFLAAVVTAPCSVIGVAAGLTVAPALLPVAAAAAAGSMVVGAVSGGVLLGKAIKSAVESS